MLLLAERPRNDSETCRSAKKSKVHGVMRQQVLKRYLSDVVVVQTQSCVHGGLLRSPLRCECCQPRSCKQRFTTLHSCARTVR